MKHLLSLITFCSLLVSCNISDDYLIWNGPKEVSREAQVVVFSPDQPVDVSFLTVAAYSFSDTQEEKIIAEEIINCNDSDKVVINNGKQRIESDWFTIYQANADIIIELKECSCAARRLTIDFDDTITTGVNIISLLQSS